ncbi:MAG: methylenetetrahydrofolate reductase [Clostridiales bacterium]|nr:methylenetetrahydrofolate reductase [Clostridiales bacterium]
MFIKDLYARKKPVISLEIFPPKKEAGFLALVNILREVSRLSPDFVSVTCGAGGSANEMEKTRTSAATLKNEYHIEPLAHITCVATDERGISKTVEALRADGITNILALRGDLPKSEAPRDYPRAARLIEEITALGGFCVGAACYPEGHIESGTLEEDIAHLKEKQDAGASFLISQLFFDNEIFYRFLEKARAAGVSLPVSAGVMPILSRSQIERMIFMCGASLPSAIIKLLRKHENSPADLRAAGIERALAQMEDLVKNGADGTHIYTMNHADIAVKAMAALA